MKNMFDLGSRFNVLAYFRALYCVWCVWEHAPAFTPFVLSAQFYYVLHQTTHHASMPMWWACCRYAYLKKLTTELGENQLCLGFRARGTNN